MPTRKTPATPATPAPVLRKLTLSKETLRRLTAAQLRVAAGGFGCVGGIPSRGTFGC